MLGFYNYTVVLTYFGGLLAFTGITFAISGDVKAALICLMLAGVCDMFDGKIAATKTRTTMEKKFGIQIDSLCDLISFGVLPAVIVYISSNQSDFSFYIAGLYTLCALIRLAYFNADEEERQSESQEPREIYTGLPVTTAALIIPMVFALGNVKGIPLAKISPFVLLAMSVAFVMPFKLRKPKFLGKNRHVALWRCMFYHTCCGGKHMSGSTRTVKFLYCTMLGRLLLQILQKSGFDKVIVKFLRSTYSQPFIGWYSKRHGIVLDPSEQKGFQTYRDFFIRTRTTIKIDSTPGHLISPCDGYLSAFTIQSDSSFYVKNSYYRLCDLIQDGDLSKQYRDGDCLIFRLCASDYHHYCYIDDGYQGEKPFHSGRTAQCSTNSV